MTARQPLPRARVRTATGSRASACARVRLADLMAAEALKLRRSMVWPFVVLLPLLAVVTGCVNYWGNREVLTTGWESLTSQVTLFYSLFFFSVGVALVCSAVWRPEHRGTTWNAVLTTPADVRRVVGAKALVALVPVGVMQVVLVVLTWAGAAVLGVDDVAPGGFATAAAVGVVAAVPLVALQCALSMRLRSFGAPVALGLVGTFVGLGLSVRAPGAVASLWPYSLVTRALSLGSSALSHAGNLDWAGAGQVLGASAVSGLVFGTVLAVAAGRAGRGD